VRRPLDIPFDRDGSGRFLPWFIALMVYLAGLGMGGALALDRALDRWERGLEGSLTVLLPPLSTAPDTMAAALADVKAASGVRSARAVSRGEIAALLAPWLGPEVPRDLALPRLIDVRIDAAHPPDLAALKAKLGKDAPDATLDDGRHWLAPMAALVRAIEAAALGIVLLVGGAAVLSVVFATRTGLAVHHDVIELLHLMGARDSYIVGQFERRALKLGLTGGALGLALAYATLLPGARLAAPEGLALAPWHYAALALLPFAAALLAVATARRTVGRALALQP
jgi:cell division transport system permease protein